MSSTTCQQCGHETASTSKFCPSCGAPKPELAAPPAPPAPPAAPAAPASASTSVLPEPPRPPAQATAQPPAAPRPDWNQPRPGGSSGPGVTAVLFGSLTWPTVLVFAGAALAFGLPTLVYAFGTYGSDGSKAALALLLALTVAASVVGTVGASVRTKVEGEERTAARLVLGVGVFASVLSVLAFLTALGQ
jgi:hypothetical protein